MFYVGQLIAALAAHCVGQTAQAVAGSNECFEAVALLFSLDTLFLPREEKHTPPRSGFLTRLQSNVVEKIANEPRTAATRSTQDKSVRCSCSFSPFRLSQSAAAHSDKAYSPTRTSHVPMPTAAIPKRVISSGNAIEPTNASFLTLKAKPCTIQADIIAPLAGSQQGRQRHRPKSADIRPKHASTLIQASRRGSHGFTITSEAGVRLSRWMASVRLHITV